MSRRKRRVYALISTKGGVGKSTVAVCLASAAVQAGHRVLLVDADRQESATKWHRRAGKQVPKEQLPDLCDLATFQARPEGKEDLVLIDCPGRMEGVVLSALASADRALILCGQTRFETDELMLSLALVAQVHKERPDLRALVLLSRLRPRMRLAERARTQVRALGLPVCQTEITDRAAYQMVDEGELPRGVAAEESARLLAELLAPGKLPWPQLLARLQYSQFYGAGYKSRELPPRPAWADEATWQQLQRLYAQGREDAQAGKPPRHDELQQPEVAHAL